MDREIYHSIKNRILYKWGEMKNDKPKYFCAP